MAALRGIKTQQSNIQEAAPSSAALNFPAPSSDNVPDLIPHCGLDDPHLFTVITYNAHSLLAPARMEMLMEELAGIQWDVVALTETWREHQRENVQVRGNHMFYGSGGRRGQRGVGFLVHERLGKHKFTAVYERIAVLELAGRMGKFWIICVYMPDATYPDETVSLVYQMLEELLRNATRRNIACLLAGDLNAQLGARSDFDDPYVTGPFGCFPCNA